MQTPMDSAIPHNTNVTNIPYYFMGQGANGGPDFEGDVNQLLIREGARTVLIADDSLTERANLARILQSAGFEVIMASSGNEAIALAVEHEPDAIFLDIIMDDGDGYKACRSIKRNPVTASTPIVMVSSKSNAVDVKWAEKLGASSYVIKPYSDEDILKKLEML